MLSRRLASARTLRSAISTVQRPALGQHRAATGYSQKMQLEESDIAGEYPNLTDKEDPGMNGGYVNPPFVKRQFRDPYGDWWDKQERRNYGEPVHEDNDILGMFTPHEYTEVTPGKAFFQLGCFVIAVFGLSGVVYQFYPDQPAVPKQYEDGLETELGGPGALRAKKAGDTPFPH